MSEVSDIVKRFFEKHVFRIIYFLGIVLMASYNVKIIYVGSALIILLNGVCIAFYITAMFRPEIANAGTSLISKGGTIDYFKLGLYFSENLLYTGLMVLLHYYILAGMTFFVVILSVIVIHRIAKERKKEWLEQSLI